MIYLGSIFSDTKRKKLGSFSVRNLAESPAGGNDSRASDSVLLDLSKIPGDELITQLTHAGVFRYNSHFQIFGSNS